jgi:hypothetical protein
MAKAPSKQRPTRGTRPEPAQLKAVERLIEAGDYPQVIERARSLA